MTASAPAYLKAFVESVAELPAELRRTFQLMRELDAKAASLQRQADLDARTCLLNGGKVGGERERERASGAEQRAAGCVSSWRRRRRVPADVHAPRRRSLLLPSSFRTRRGRPGCCRPSALGKQRAATLTPPSHSLPPS